MQKGRPRAGKTAPAGHACGGGCAAPLARLQLMKANIREFEPSDEEPVVGLSLRALEPVFAAREEMLVGQPYFVTWGESEMT